MLTGRRAFPGDAHVPTPAAILRSEPRPPGEVAPHIPRKLERIVVRYLRKDPARRFQHTDDLKIALQELKEEAESGGPGQPDPARAPRSPAKRLPVLAVAVAFVLAGAALFLRPPGDVAPGSRGRDHE